MAVDHKEIVKHQLRDSHGRWIKMGFKVKWNDLDGTHVGTVIGAVKGDGHASFKPTAIVREYDKHGHDLGHSVKIAGTSLSVIHDKAVLHYDMHGHLVNGVDPHLSLVGMPQKLHKASVNKDLPAISLSLTGDHSPHESPIIHGFATKLSDLHVGDELYPVHSSQGNGKSPFNLSVPQKDALISTKPEDSLGKVVKNDPAKGYIVVEDAHGNTFFPSKKHFGVVRNASADEALMKADKETGNAPTPWISKLAEAHIDPNHGGGAEGGSAEASASASTSASESTQTQAQAQAQASTTQQTTVHAVQDNATGKIKVSTSDYSPILSDVSTLKPGDQIYPRGDNYGHNAYSTPKVSGDATAVVDPAGPGLGTVVKVDAAKGTVRIKNADGQTSTLKFGDNVFKRTNAHDKTLSDAFKGYSEHNQQPNKWLGEVKAAHAPEHAPQAPKEEAPKAEMPNKPEFAVLPYNGSSYSPKKAPSAEEKPASAYKPGDILIPAGTGMNTYYKRSDGNWDVYHGNIHIAGQAKYERTVSDPFAENLPGMNHSLGWDSKLIHDGADPKAIADKIVADLTPHKPAEPNKPEAGANLKGEFDAATKKVKVSDAGNHLTTSVGGLKLGDHVYPVGDSSNPYVTQSHNVHDGSVLVDPKSEHGMGVVVQKGSNGATIKSEDGKSYFVSNYSGGQALKQSDAIDSVLKDATPAEHAPAAPAAEAPHVETPAEAEHKAEVADHPMSIDGWKKVAGKSGSNPGGVYEDPTGKQWMVKFPQTSDHARNEVLAANLTKLAGIEATDMQLIDAGNGKLGVAAPMVKIKDDLKHQLDTNPEFKAKVQEGFAVDAWLANWDTIGLAFDNIVSDENGNPLRVDPGGSLLYRAMGTPKGDAFGNKVGEWDSLRNGQNYQTTHAFGDMTDQQLIDSAKRVESITPEQIAKQVDAMGFDEAKTKGLKDKLIARREDVIARAAALKPAHEEPAAPEAPKAEEPAPVAPAEPVHTPAETAPKAEEAPQAAPHASEPSAPAEDPFAKYQFIDKGKTTADANGETLKVGDLINHKSGKHGTGKVLKVLPSTDTVQVVYPNGTEIKHKGNTVSKVMEHAAPKAAEELPKLEPGQYHKDTATGKHYIGAKDGTPLGVGDRITYTKQGQTKSGTVKSIYPGDSAVAIKWDDGSTTGTKKKASAVLKEDAPKAEDHTPASPAQEAPSAPEAPAHEAPATPEHAQPEPAAPQDGTALNETEKALDIANGDVSAADFEGKNFGEVPDKVIEDAPAGSSLVSKSAIHDGTKSVFVKGEDGKWNLEGTQAKLDTQDMLGAKAGAGDKFTFHGPSEDGPKAPTEPATASDIASYDGKALNEVPADHIAALPVGTRLVKENGSYREKTDDNSWKMLKKDGTPLLSSTQTNEDIQSIASHSGTGYKVQLPGATPEPAHEAPSEPAPAFDYSQVEGKTLKGMSEEQVAGLPVGTKLVRNTGGFREKQADGMWHNFKPDGTRSTQAPMDTAEVIDMHDGMDNHYHISLPKSAENTPQAAEPAHEAPSAPSAEPSLAQYHGQTFDKLPAEEIKNLPVGTKLQLVNGDYRQKIGEDKWGLFGSDGTEKPTIGNTDHAISKFHDAAGELYTLDIPGGHSAPSNDVSAHDGAKLKDVPDDVIKNAPAGSYFTSPMGTKTIKGEDGMWHTQSGSKVGPSTLISKKEEGGAVANGFKFHSPDGTSHGTPAEQPSGADLWKVGASTESTDLLTKDAPVGSELTGEDGHVFVKVGKDKWQSVWPDGDPQPGHLDNQEVQHALNSGEQHWKVSDTNASEKADPFAAPQAAPEPVDISHVADENGHIAPSALSQLVGMKIKDIHGLNFDELPTGTKIGNGDGYLVKGSEGWKVISPNESAHGTYMNHGLVKMVATSESVDPSKDWTLASVGHGSGEDFLSQPQISGDALQAHVGQKLYEMPPISLSGAPEGTQITKEDGTYFTKVGPNAWQVGGSDWTGHTNWTDLSVKDMVYSSPDGTLEHTLTSAGNGSAAPAQSGTTLGDFNQSGFHGLEKGTQIKYTGYESTKGVYTKTGEDTWSFTPEGHPTASNKVITNAMFEHVLGTDSAKSYSVTPPEHVAPEAATSEVTDPHLQKGMDPSVGYLDSLPSGSTIRVEKSWVSTYDYVFAAKNEDGSWNIYKKTPSTLKTYKESVSANDARYYLGVSYGGSVTASLPKGDKSAILGSGELAHVGDTVMYEHQPHEVLKINKTGLSLQPVNGGEKVSAKPSKLYKDANFSKAEHTYHSSPTVHDPISKSYEGYQKEQEAKNALKNFAGASADEYNAQGLTMPHDANPDLSSSVKAYGADPVDTTNPLYGTPKPQEPTLQLPEQVTLPSKWDSAGWLEKVKQRYLDNPNKAKASLEQSNKWSKVQQVVENGDKAALQNLLDSKYVDESLYHDALTKIDAGNPEYDAQKTAYDNAVKAATDKYNAEKAKYQSDLADWNKANPAAVDKPYVAAVLPAVSQENFTSGSADWTKGHIGTHTASTVMAAIKDDNVLGTHGLSFAVDSDQIEYLDVKATKVLDKSGTEVFEFKFKVTGLHGDALVAALDKRQGVSKSSGMHLVKKKPDPATGLLRDTEDSLGSIHSGHRYTYTDSETGASVVYQGGAAHSDHNNPTINNTAVIQMPLGSTPEDFQKTIANLGIENARPSTEGDIRVLGENQILAMFGKSVGNTKIWDSNKNFSGPQREKQLADIKEKYGVSVDDLVFKTEQNGRVRFELSDQKAQALAERYGVLGATHNVAGAHDANTWVSILSGDNPGLLSTYHRWSEGIGGTGMSSAEDMSSGSGDYIYMTPFTTGETHKATSGYKAVLKPSALFKRIDWYANSSDNYGKKGSSNSSPYGLFDAKGGSTNSGIYEALPKDTVPLKDFSHVVISDDNLRQQVIDKLKAKGIYEINGFPVEEFVIGNNGQPPIDLTKYA